MANDRDPSELRPERPRSEPEIIPPDRGQRHGGEYVWMSSGQEGATHRIYIARPGPFSIVVALLIAGLVLGLIVLLLLGLALIWIPAIVFVIAAFLVAGYARHYWARLKLWAGRR